MGSDFENWVEGLKKTSLIGGVVAKGKIDHSEVNRLELSSLNTHEKLANYGMRSIAPDDKATRVRSSIAKLCSDAPLGTQAQM